MISLLSRRFWFSYKIILKTKKTLITQSINLRCITNANEMNVSKYFILSLTRSNETITFDYCINRCPCKKIIDLVYRVVIKTSSPSSHGHLIYIPSKDSALYGFTTRDFRSPDKRLSCTSRLFVPCYSIVPPY